MLRRKRRCGGPINGDVILMIAISGYFCNNLIQLLYIKSKEVDYI